VVLRFGLDANWVSALRVYEREAYLGMREYIHANPVKRFLVATAADYPYSSVCPEFEMDPPPQRLKALLESAGFGIAKAMP
jgi:hypothetical protein